MRKIFTALTIFILYNLAFTVLPGASLIIPAHAIYDPTTLPNNKFGIHIISPTPQELDPAIDLVNTNGDWGYITVLIESKDRDVSKWQQFFNTLRKKHLIPIVRLATAPEGGNWKRPTESDINDWADFLDKLNWPIKNRYVLVYNEPNQAQEWGGTVDAPSYAKVLDQTITALKAKSEDFFVLNAGFDASAPQKLPAYQDEISFLQQMEEAVPGILSRLDGWNSHSYPNPGFVGSPEGTGRGTVRTYFWELQTLRNLGVSKNLPVFITETGWKHAEGIAYDPSLPTSDTVAQNYIKAFENAWSTSRVVAVTPFLLTYQQAPFDHFSFKKYTGQPQDLKILGQEYPDFYSPFEAIRNLPKTSGAPQQIFSSKLVKGEVFTTLVAGENYQVHLTFQNNGQSIWGDGEPIKLVATKGAAELGINSVELPKDTKIEPGGEYTFVINIKAPASGKHIVSLNLFHGNKQFDSPALQTQTEVKSPVILRIQSGLKWKKDFSGEYLLSVAGAVGQSISQVVLDPTGASKDLEARYLLPDYSFEFSLEKPFYQKKTITQTIHSGINILDFGELQPDISSAILNPPQLWNLLPFSN